ncbi:MAG: universal stress protein [Armatimonadetes bacterium]|nr:universal stress protein [Armatimonadota bacterium]MDW8120755.1 universal stress protein [Armatimonadota bacterium]
MESEAKVLLNPHPLGVLIALSFVIILLVTIAWMLRVPQPLQQLAARAVFSVEQARQVIVPILDLSYWRADLESAYYTERAVELACRLVRNQEATIGLVYVVEMPRSLSLDAPLPEVQEQKMREALENARQIVRRHGLNWREEIRRCREADQGIRQAAQESQADLIVLGAAAGDRGFIGKFARIVDPLLRNPPCEVLIDSLPAPSPS